MYWKTLALLIGVLCLNPARAADVMTDQDRRAAATVYSCYAEHLVNPDTITPAQLKPGLTRFEKDATKNTALYSLNFGGVTNGVDTRGYLRVTIGEQLTDATKAGWTSLKVDPASGAEILFRRVENSNADKFLEIGVRRKFGNVILSIAQRQPITLSPDNAGKAVLQRFVMLTDFAKQTKLLGGQIKLMLVSRPNQPQLGADALPVSVSDNKETEMAIQISALDTDGAVRNDVKRMDVQIIGSLAALCKLKVRGGLVDIKQVTHIKDPDPKQEITLILPACNNLQVLQALYADCADRVDDSTPQGLSIRVGVQFK